MFLFWKFIVISFLSYQVYIYNRNKDIIDAKIYKDWKFKHTRRFIHGLESGMKFVPSILGDVVGLRKRDADGYAIDTSRFWKGKAEKDTSNNASR